MDKYERQTMMKAMMERFFSGMSPDEKREMCATMMGKMSEGHDLGEIVPKMMMDSMSAGGGDDRVSKSSLEIGGRVTSQGEGLSNRGERTMSEVMARLFKEHQSIAKILRALEHQLSIFDTTERPDYDVLTAIAEYFTGFPERCHHPKEDLVYRKMCNRDPGLARTMTDLEAEHDKISALAHRFRDVMQNVLQEAEVSRGALNELARHFVRQQWCHMQMEEELYFPLALKILTPDDWVEIDERITREEDPVFRDEVSHEFEALRDDILEWEEEDEALEG